MGYLWARVQYNRTLWAIFWHSLCGSCAVEWFGRVWVCVWVTCIFMYILLHAESVWNLKQFQNFQDPFCLVYSIQSIIMNKKFIVYTFSYNFVGGNIYVPMLYKGTKKEIQYQSPVCLWSSVPLLPVTCVLSTVKFDWFSAVQAVSGIHGFWR